MSSTTTTTTTTTTTERQTYWCHECDMSVNLLTPPPTTTTIPQPLLCPHCHSDFLEQMDSTTTTTHNSNPNTDSDPSTTTTTFTTHDDNFLLESPFFTRLIQHLTDASSDNETKTFSFIETIPTIKITSSLLEKDPVLLCAICKDQFVVDVEVKQLPCNHLYHCECITPWLKNHNSCPVCRFKIPTETETETTTRRRRRGMAGVVRFGEFLEDDEDSFGFGSTLQHIARRHGMVLSNVGEGRGNDDVDGVNVLPDVRLLSTSLPADLRI